MALVNIGSGTGLLPISLEMSKIATPKLRLKVKHIPGYVAVIFNVYVDWPL